MYVGLDLSLTKTGMCALFDSTVFETDTVGHLTLRGSERLDFVFDGIRRFFQKITDAGDTIDMVAVEGYALGTPGGKSFDRAELAGLVKWWLYKQNYPFIIVVPGTLKKFATGNGSADKIQMCLCARETYGVEFEADWGYRYDAKKPKPRPANWGTKDNHWRNDECDAYFLANVAAAYNGDWDRNLSTTQLGAVELIATDPQGTLTADNNRRKKRGE